MDARTRRRLWIELAAVVLVCVVPAHLYSLLGPQASVAEVAAGMAAGVPRYLGMAGLAWMLLSRDESWRPPIPRRLSVWLWELPIGCIICVVLWATGSWLRGLLAEAGVPPGSSWWQDVYGAAFKDGTVRIIYAVGTPFAALYEEMVFRVYTIERLERLLGRASLWPIVIASALFALEHQYGLQEELEIFAVGLAYGAIYVSSRRLPRLVVAHWFHNLLVMCQFL